MLKRLRQVIQQLKSHECGDHECAEKCFLQKELWDQLKNDYEEEGKAELGNRWTRDPPGGTTQMAFFQTKQEFFLFLSLLVSTKSNQETASEGCVLINNNPSLEVRILYIYIFIQFSLSSGMLKL